MLVMSTQLLGFSLGGILRRFLVQPPSMSEHFDISGKHFTHERHLRSLAGQSCDLCPIQHASFSLLYRYRYPRRGLTRTLLPDCVGGWPVLVLPSWLSFPSTLLLFLGMLDRAK